MSTSVPNIDTPLVRDGGGEDVPSVVSGLGPLAGLIGTWNSPTTNPTGYNVMPLPQATAPNKFILKDFSYYEEMTFSAIAGNVPNRGGTYEQDGYVLFYEQRVYFGEGPSQNNLVHAENGAWIHLVTGPQLQGPYGQGGPSPTPPAPNPIPSQPANRNIVKQVSVPHGNSILALGTYSESSGAPTIPNVSTLPTGSGVTPSFYTPYGENDPSNPMVNPNVVLQDALEDVTISNTIKFDVSTKNLGGAVTNIYFEQKHANVTGFTTTFWLETLDDGSLQLQYSQTIEMTLKQNNVVYYHIDANTLTKVT